MFFSTVYCPTLQREVKVFEMNNRYYIALQKFLIEGDDKKISKFFDDIISECTEIYDDTHKLAAIDKAILLCKIYGTSIGNIINLQVGKIQVPISVSKIIEKLLTIPPLLEKLKTIPKHAITLSPATLIKAGDNIIESMIYRVNSVYLSQIDEEDKGKFFNSIDAHIIDDISKYIVDRRDSASFVLVPENIELKINEIKISIFNTSCYDLIKIIYNDSLIDIYSLQYNLYSKVNLGAQNFYSITPAEARIFLKLYKDEHEIK